MGIYAINEENCKKREMKNKGNKTAENKLVKIGKDEILLSERAKKRLRSIVGNSHFRRWLDQTC